MKMKETESDNLVTVGSHVIVQRLNFKKIYRVTESGTLPLGKEEINMSTIIGKPFWTTFKVIPSNDVHKKKSKRNPPSNLLVAEKSDSLEDLKNVVASGFDNRSINDDGKSQKLSKEDIMELRDAGKSGREIVNSLIENNVSFVEKTEYSQEKYIKKKEKKYCQFLTVLKPTLSLLHEIYIKQDPVKINGLRMDTLAQIFSYSDIKCDGTFILYDSGSVGLVASGMLSRLGLKSNGNLLYLHSGDHLPQMPILRAMNFQQEQLDKLTTVSIFDFLRTYYKQNKSESESAIKVEKMSIEVDETPVDESIKNSITINVQDCEEEKCDIDKSNDLKRKNNDSLQEENVVIKKSRKVLAIEQAVDIITHSKADSLTVVAKEHPLNIVRELLPFVKASRPFVIYHTNREPLEETYIALKQENNLINLKLFSNFLRSYQVLPDRTHPDILMNDHGGYILTGYTVN